MSTDGRDDIKIVRRELHTLYAYMSDANPARRIRFRSESYADALAALSRLQQAREEDGRKLATAGGLADEWEKPAKMRERTIEAFAQKLDDDEQVTIRGILAAITAAFDIPLPVPITEAGMAIIDKANQVCDEANRQHELRVAAESEEKRWYELFHQELVRADAAEAQVSALRQALQEAEAENERQRDYADLCYRKMLAAHAALASGEDAP